MLKVLCTKSLAFKATSKTQMLASFPSKNLHLYLMFPHLFGPENDP